jgi:hypothetical protein
MLDALAPEDEPAAIAAATPAPPEPSGVRQAAATEPVPPQTTNTQAEAAATVTSGPQTDLVGLWRAEADGTTIELAIDEGSKFEWSATPAGGTATKVSGDVLATSDTLVLDSETQGPMVGRVQPISSDEFRFALAGGPADSKGLDFRRVR